MYHEIKRIIVTFLRGLSKGYVLVSISQYWLALMPISESSCTSPKQSLTDRKRRRD